MTEDAVALASLVASSSIRSVRVVAWRDLDDPEAGGSELHMDEILQRWAAAGLRVDARTSAVVGRPARVRRHGYFVEREGGRYQVFPQVFLRGRRRDRHEYDALVEIWNGVPFFGPLWFKGPRVTWLHHVHSEMWRLSMPRPLAALGWWVERTLAPVFYRRERIATLSASSAEDIKVVLGLSRVTVIPVGVSAFYSPAGPKSPVPLVVAVGRLVPVKQYHLLINEFAATRALVPDATFVIVGEGYLRSDLEAQIDALGAHSWITLPGHVDDETLRDLYRSAWVVTSHSLREGWGMSITEAAACGTTSVVVDIAGHRDAVDPGRSGVLVPAGSSLGAALAAVLTDHGRREKLSEGARDFAAQFNWDAVALRHFELLSGS